MDGQSSGLDFALISHMESWQYAQDFLEAARKSELKPLTLEQIQDSFPYFPPRKVFNITARSTFDQRVVKGAYIETFISPDELGPRHFKKMLKKVKEAAVAAVREGAKITTLGGFTSIILEGRTYILPGSDKTAFTTGNTLTAAYVVKGMELACKMYGVDLNKSNLLILGSTGDIGTACVRYFSGKVKKMLLCARNKEVLANQHDSLTRQGLASEYSTDSGALIPRSDLIISVASTAKPLFSLNDCLDHTLVCDAGYPKNIIAQSKQQLARLWKGGMGQIKGGYVFEPNYSDGFYKFPAPYSGHGCLIEPLLLAMENRYESFSTKRGEITVDKIEEIWTLAKKHGCTVAPFFNMELWDRQPKTNDYG